MTARNDITGDKIQTGVNSEAYRGNKFWDKKQDQQAESEQKDILYGDKDAQKLTAYLGHTESK